jgi:aspartate dehydrogenase
VISVGLIGCGGIAQDIAALKNSGELRDILLVGAIAGSAKGYSRKVPAGVEILDSLDHLLERRPEIVAEIAGQQAVSDHCETVLRRGIDCIVVSTGALADPALFERLQRAAHEGQSQILLPAGAIGGIDAITSMKLAGLHSVRYRSIKPPAAWRGTPAYHLIDFEKLGSRMVFFKGSAREAALRFPQNANVAATVALAGLGFEATEVELIVDPQATENIHEIDARGVTGTMSIRLQGQPSQWNPKTSALTALSVARALLHTNARIVI